VGDLSGGELGRFAHSANSLQLDFFAGSYAAVRPFSYEYRLDDREWQRVTTGSSVLLSDLHEGHYDLAVRTVDGDGTAGPATGFRLEIAPPWYRRWYAFASYPLLAAGLMLGVQRLAVRRARRRQIELERQVTERTGELNIAMERLEQVTMTSATLAERNRLAVEIHDSLEQGFAGLSLQLETTAGLPGCPPPVKSGLTSALNMVAFCRDEIRHAVQGLHSPVLDSVDLGAALKQIATQLVPLADFATIRVEGTPRPTDPATEHHLLRIAQEAIANVVKHAEARRLEIILAYEADGIRLCIRDDGKGFDPEAVRRGPGGHFGLPSFRSRAGKIGGSVRIDSRREAGTTITVRVPDTLNPKA
jgi:signal transduction histidine kinase